MREVTRPAPGMVLTVGGFTAGVAKVNALIERGEFKMIAIGPVVKTQIGEKDMQFAAVTEFETFEKAMSFKKHPDYVDALNELGDDEAISVKRTSCVVS
ncbi:MAG: hypothetical protein VCB25_06375, partial [Myxococcota bacterium]